MWLEIELLEGDVPTRSKDDTIGQHSCNGDDDDEDGGGADEDQHPQEGKS